MWKERQSWLPIWRCCPSSSSSSLAWSAELSIQVRAHTCRRIITHARAHAHAPFDLYMVWCVYHLAGSGLLSHCWRKHTLFIRNTCVFPANLFRASIIPGNLCTHLCQWLCMKHQKGLKCSRKALCQHLLVLFPLAINLFMCSLLTDWSFSLWNVNTKAIAISQQCLHSAYFVWPTFWNQKIFN